MVAEFYTTQPMKPDPDAVVAAILTNLVVTPFVGKAVIHCRGRAHMTQKELALAAGLHESALKKVEAGRKTGGWVNTLESICRALGMKLKQLFEIAEQLALEDAVKAAFANLSR